jgi:hypothetical protein
MLERPPFPQIVDSSMMNAFRSCPQKFALEYLHHWRPGEQSVHLVAGKAFANGLEAARLAFYDQGCDHDLACGRGVLALLAEYGDFEPPEESPKHPLRMAQALVYYFDIWPFETDHAKPIRRANGSSAVEFSFAQPLDFPHPETNDPIILSGRADMVCEMAQGIFIEDDKTTSALGASWYNQWELRSQFSAYTWAAREIGLPVSGVLVRGVGILKTDFKSGEHITFRAQWETERWYEQTLRDLARMRSAWLEGYFDFNLGDACDSWGGCVFTRVCKSPPASRQGWLESYYSQRRWNPLTRMEELQ